MKSIYLRVLRSVVASAVVVAAGVGPVMAKECIDCHTDIHKQLKSNSHHIQGTGISGKHCYACHWEATADGRINTRYHKAAGTKKTSRDASIDLVVWQEGVRPSSYIAGSTAVTFHATAIGTDAERQEVTKISQHCLGCHSDRSNQSRPFIGDANTPLAYAWDGQSVASRYSQKGLTTWGKYSTAGTNKKQRISKAFSAHGNAAANQGGWNSSNGYDNDMPTTRGGARAKNVECFDCHNSHGSSVSGVTSSYRTFDGSFNGGILKQTSAGKGGYRINYKPSVNSYAHSVNPFNAGAGLCFDCHENATAETTPWGFNSTFGAQQPIMGYKDTFGFGSGKKGSSTRFANRQGRDEIISSHLKAGEKLGHTAQGQINGLCTPCHDPHGVSRTLGDKMAYAVPLLKGTWLTSPYREDGPPSGLTVTGDTTKRNNGAANTDKKIMDDYNRVNREANANFGKGASTSAREADYNRVNREANANFGKSASAAPRQDDYNTVNREASANFGKGASTSAREADYNRVNREVNANFGKGASTAPRQDDYNTVNRETSANFGKGASTSAREADYNRVNREVNANFGKGASTAPRHDDYNTVNREASANFGKGGSGVSRTIDSNTANRDANSNFAKGGSGAPREPMQGMKYNVDRNTFVNDSRITETDDIFGGLCLKCHSRENLDGNSKSGAIHRAVKGWGNNKEHSFPCSKCHQPHNSGLPRLMQVNCFEQGPAGLRENSGVPWLPYRKSENGQQNKTGQSAVIKSSAASKNKIVGCHVKQFGKATAASSREQEGTQWKDVTSW